MATLKDVAKRAGVSYSTVSYILNSDKAHLYADSTVQKVREAAEMLRYRTNAFARSLKTGKTGIIGVVGSYGMSFLPSHLYFTRIYHGISMFFSGLDYKFIFNSFTDLSKEGKGTELLDRNLVDGIICILLSNSVEDFKNSWKQVLEERDIPFSIIHSLTDDLGCNTVGTDCMDAGATAAKHLLKHGYGKQGGIGVVRVSENRIHVDNLVAGYAAAMKKAGHETVIYQAGNYFTKFGYQLADQWLRDGEKLKRAYFCVADSVALGMMTRFREAGIRVPKDVALVGFGDDLNQDDVMTGLTTVSQPAFSKGHLAAQYLFNQIQDAEGGYEPQCFIFKPKLVVRESCGCREKVNLENGSRNDE